MTTLNGKVALVTGSARGIGRGEALALAKEGAAVVIVDVLEDLAVRTAQEIESLGCRSLALVCDVSQRAAVEHAVQAAALALGPVDILVNNAQIIPDPGPLESWTEQQMRDCYESGFMGSFNLMQACFPAMKHAGCGRIINTVSAAGHGIVPGYSGYGAAKEAIRSLTRSAAREWGQYGITVNAVSPTAISPGVIQKYPTDEAQIALIRALGAALPRWSDPEADIGRVVAFLASSDARQITGCTLSVDGGLGMI